MTVVRSARQAGEDEEGTAESDDGADREGHLGAAHERGTGSVGQERAGSPTSATCDRGSTTERAENCVHGRDRHVPESSRLMWCNAWSSSVGMAAHAFGSVLRAPPRLKKAREVRRP
jgi:hypothetical protein